MHGHCTGCARAGELARAPHLPETSISCVQLHGLHGLSANSLVAGELRSNSWKTILIEPILTFTRAARALSSKLMIPFRKTLHGLLLFTRAVPVQPVQCLEGNRGCAPPLRSFPKSISFNLHSRKTRGLAKKYFATTYCQLSFFCFIE